MRVVFLLFLQQQQPETKACLDACMRAAGAPEDRKRLYPFQREAAELIWRKLYRDDRPVVILADDVGLGKTYTALEVIRRATETGHTGALVLCPSRLESMWRGYTGMPGERTTLDDPVNFSVVTHERIPSRRRGGWTGPRARRRQLKLGGSRSSPISAARATPLMSRRCFAQSSFITLWAQLVLSSLDLNVAAAALQGSSP